MKTLETKIAEDLANAKTVKDLASALSLWVTLSAEERAKVMRRLEAIENKSSKFERFTNGGYDEAFEKAMMKWLKSRRTIFVLLALTGLLFIDDVGWVGAFQIIGRLLFGG